MANGLRLSHALIFGLVLSSLVCNAAAVFPTRSKEVKNSPPSREGKITQRGNTDEGVTSVYGTVYYYNCK